LKRVLCAVFALAMLFSMTACSGEGNEGEKKDPLLYVLEVSPDYAKAEEEEFGVELADYSANIKLPELDNTTVDVLMSIDWEYLRANNDETEPFGQYHATLMWRDTYKATGGDVKITTITENEMTDHVAAGTAAGNAPDIIPANYDLTYPQWNAAGLTASVEDYAEYLDLKGKNPNKPDEDLYNQTLMNNYFQWGGESHGAITEPDVDRNYIVYNSTIFSMFDETTPLEHWKNGNWTWTQFVETCEALTNDDQKGFTGWGLFPYFAPYPMAKLNDDNTVTLNTSDEKYMLYMDAVYDLYQKSEAARRDNSLQTWNNTFPLGIDAMVQTTKAGFKRIVDKAVAMDSDDFGIAPIPAFDLAGETVGIPTATLWAYSIAKEADNPIGAATYIRLETLVCRNVQAALEGTTWYDNEENVTAEEQAMIEEIESDDEHICVELIRGIGSCYDIVDTSIVPPIYYEPNQNSVSSVFDSFNNMLQAEFDDFNAEVIDAA